MKNLETMLSSDATDFERQLLGAVAAERPSPELQLRMQRAIGLAPVALQGPDAGSGGGIGGPEISGTHLAAQPASHGAVATWLKVVLGVAGAGVVAGGLALRASEPAPITRASTPERDQTAQAAPVEAPAPVAPSATISRELREEIDLLDRVRTALDQRDARAASALLASYAKRFPEGKLAGEANVLRAQVARIAR